MKRTLLTLLLLIGYISTASAFEIDGFKSGISMEEARILLKKYSYQNIKVKDSSVYAENSLGGRYINMSFCNNELVQISKDLNPSFESFVRLVDDMRDKFGKPVDAFSRPPTVTSPVKIQSLAFFWKDNDTIIEVDYTKFPKNDGLNITYEIHNKCYDIPY